MKPRSIFALASMFLLVSCATAIQGQTQRVMIETPGVEDAVCRIQNSQFRYVVYPPRLMNIQRSAEPYAVECIAPGNRFKTVMLKPTIDKMASLNIFNLVMPGATVDYISNAAFKFPELVAVDFTGMPPQAMPEPAHMRMFAQNPDIVGVEEFRPHWPALIRDKDSVPMELRRTDRALAGMNALNPSVISDAKDFNGVLGGVEVIMPGPVSGPTSPQQLAP